MKDLCLSVLCDENYLEAALLTASELVRRKPAGVPLYLVYLESPGGATAEVDRLLLDFQAAVQTIDQVRPIKVRNDVLGPFGKFHFTNSILYKLLIPSVLQHDRVLNIDAGFLLGRKFEQWLGEIGRLDAGGALDKAVVAAFCGASDTELPEPLRQRTHHALYPAGAVFLFNRRNYMLGDFYTRIVTASRALCDELVWAEQDLLCLLLEGDELVPLPLKHELAVEQLGLDGLLEDKTSIGEDGDYCLYKIAGTLKPWKPWVLDPRKRFYLGRRKALDRYLQLGNYPVIAKHRHAVTHEPFARAFLELHEAKLAEGAC